MAKPKTEREETTPAQMKKDMVKDKKEMADMMKKKRAKTVMSSAYRGK